MIATRAQADHRTDAVAIGFGSDQLNAETVIGASLVVIKVGRACVRGEEEIEEAVVIDIGVSRRAGDFRRGERLAHLVGDFGKFSAPEVAKKVGRFGVADALLYAFDFVFDVTVSDEDVGPAIVVVIKEETGEAEGDEGVASDFGLRRFVDEQAVALVVIERNHLVGEVADQNTRVAAAVVVGGIGAHARTGDSVFAEADAGGDPTLLKGSVLLVDVELVGLGVVGDQNVRPAVGVVVENRDAEAFRGGIVQASLLRRVFELASAQVVPKANRGALVGFGRAVRLVSAVECAVEVGLLGPLHVVGDYEIELAVAIVVDPGGAGREFAGSPHAGGFRSVGKCAVAVVVEEMTLA